MMCTGAAITAAATAAATTDAADAAMRIMHRRTLRRTSIKSVSRASPMDISRLPDTGLIRGHIISERRDVARCGIARSVSRDIEWKESPRKIVGFKSARYCILHGVTRRRSTAKTVRCLITNGSQLSPEHRAAAPPPPPPVLVGSILSPTWPSMKTYQTLDCVVCQPAHFMLLQTISVLINPIY